jgi:hypothetical protein
MVRPHAALRFFRVARFLIGESDLLLSQHGAAEGVEHHEIGPAEADVFERHGSQLIRG